MKPSRRQKRPLSLKTPLSLETLLQKGHWGKLRTGISRQAVVRILGQPTRWARSTAELQAMAAGTPVAGWALSEVLQYDGVEFLFTEDVASACIGILADDLDALRLDGRPPVDAWGLSEGMAEAAVMEKLSSAGMSPSREPFPMAPRQIRLVLPSGARLGLTDDPSFFEPGTPAAGHRLFCVEASGPPTSQSRGA